MEIIIGIVDWIVNNVVGIAAGAVLLVIRAIGTVTPACGLTATWTDEVRDMIINGFAWLWPVLRWYPWEISWRLCEVYITYLGFKLMVKWLPKLVEWISILIGKILP